MEYKRSAPMHGQLDGRYATLYEYEFPRATRRQGPFLPAGSVRLREYLFCDGEHGQLVQIIAINTGEVAKQNEKSALVEKILDLGREQKRFSQGNLLSKDLSGEIREYSGKKMISLGQVLAKQEKIGLFATARLVKDRKIKQRRKMRWKLRFQLLVMTTLLIAGVSGGIFLEKNGFLDFKDNSFYQDYVVFAIQTLGSFIDHILG